MLTEITATRLISCKKPSGHFRGHYHDTDRAMELLRACAACQQHRNPFQAVGHDSSRHPEPLAQSLDRTIVPLDNITFDRRFDAQDRHR